MLLLVLVHAFVQYGKYNNGRLEFDITLMFKINNNLSDLPFHNYFKHRDKKYNFCSHNFKIKSKFCANTDQYRNFFFIRIAKV